MLASCEVPADEGTSLFPTQSWQDGWLILLQPQPTESMFPSEPWATGQSTGDVSQGRQRREGQVEHPGWLTVAGHPALLTGVFHSWLPWPRRPQHVTGVGRSRLLSKLELTA